VPAEAQRESESAFSTDRRPSHFHRWVFDQLCSSAGSQCSEASIERFGYQLSRYRPSLRPGDTVRPFDAPAERGLVCGYRCSVFFLDLLPGAHFAHPTVVGLYDHETGELQTLRGEWWPYVNDRKHVLATADTRLWSAVRQRQGTIEVGDSRRKKPTSHQVPQQVPGQSTGQLVFDSPPGCTVKAVVVNGYKTSNNTFDDDADAIYRVLRGLGIPDGRIVYLGPYQTPGRDDKITAQTLRTALQNAATPDGTCTEFFFFISTHSGNNTTHGPHLHLRQGPGQHDIFKGDELAQLLSAIPCEKLSLVIGGCDNQGLKGEIDSEMNPKGINLRYLISAGAGNNGLSWPDIDKESGKVDDNPEDVGSEVVWGYIEAIGTGSADDPPNSTVSFADATGYAMDHDFTSVLNVGGAVQSLFVPPDLAAAQACCSFGTSPGLRITPGSLGAPSKKTVGGVAMPAVKRCTNAAITVSIENQGASPVPVGTVRLHGSVWDAATGSWKPPVALADVAIATEIEKGTPQTYKLYWGVRPTYQVGDRVKLYATVDSPLDPFDFAKCVQSGFPTAACPADQQWTELEVVVKKRCPLSLKGCNCVHYAGPDL
jgi:hypothetical protein